ncbi:MAG TPA: SRPBCC family protein [Trueperaceae bacterium]
MSDRIEKSIELEAPRSRVWRAITDHREFGEWFGVKLEGPFEKGKVTRGRVTNPGYEHVTWEVFVEAIEPETLFAFTWHPHAIDTEVDYSEEPQTLVEFRLEETAGGTLLHLTESGFDEIPANRRQAAYRGNEGGWTAQMKRIESYLASRS